MNFIGDMTIALRPNLCISTAVSTGNAGNGSKLHEDKISRDQNLHGDKFARED